MYTVCLVNAYINVNSSQTIRNYTQCAQPMVTNIWLLKFAWQGRCHFCQFLFVLGKFAWCYGCSRTRKLSIWTSPNLYTIWFFFEIVIRVFIFEYWNISLVREANELDIILPTRELRWICISKCGNRWNSQDDIFTLEDKNDIIFIAARWRFHLFMRYFSSSISHFRIAQEAW